MNQLWTRRALFAGSVLIVGAVLGFIWILNIKQSEELKQTFLLYILILWFFATLAFALFYFKGVIFRVSGALERSRIITLLGSILLIVQITFAFVNFVYRETQFTFTTYDHARELYHSIDWNMPTDMLDEQCGVLPLDIDQLYVLDNQGQLLYAKPLLPADASVDYQPLDRYTFPLKSGLLGMHISKNYHFSFIRYVLLDLFTILVVSLFFSFELVLLLIRIIETKIAGHKQELGEEDPFKERDMIESRPPDHCINYIRPIAFLFYFASRMSATFLPVMAAELSKSAFDGSSGGIAASIPQSAETLFTCVAILFASEMIIKKGWKQPFLMGIGFVIAGTFLSALTYSFVMFVSARALVGLGYGFCWMTLRNLSLFGMNAHERSWGFAMFNAGLYAGMNCGQVTGSILADFFGYQIIFVISALASVVSGIAVLFIKNDRLNAPEEKSRTAVRPDAGGNKRGLVQMLTVLLLLVAPSCIMVGYSEFYIPIHMLDIGGSTSDVGRVLLLYGLVVVYLGPKMTQFARKHSGGGMGITVAYNILLAGGLVIAGLWGGFLGIAVAMVIIGLADGFGFGAQNEFVLALPFMSGMHPGRAFSLLSFLRKLTGMLGPIVFAAALSFPGGQSIFIIGIIIIVFALLSLVIGKHFRQTDPAWQ